METIYFCVDSFAYYFKLISVASSYFKDLIKLGHDLNGKITTSWIHKLSPFAHRIRQKNAKRHMTFHLVHFHAPSQVYRLRVPRT